MTTALFFNKYYFWGEMSQRLCFSKLNNKNFYPHTMKYLVFYIVFDSFI